MQRMKLLPKVGGGGYESVVANNKNFNRSMEMQNRKSTENAQFVDSKENAVLIARNADRKNATINANLNGNKIEAANATRANRDRETWEADQVAENKLTGRLLNDSFRTYQNINSKRMLHEGNDLVSKKNIWNTKYKPQYDKAVKDGNTEAANKLETSYFEEHNENPFEIDRKITKIQERSVTSKNNPYNQY